MGGLTPSEVLGDLMDPARRITLVSLVPTMLSRLLDAGLSRPPTLQVGAARGRADPGCAAGSAQPTLGVPVAPSYGMTETCSQIVTFGGRCPGRRFGPATTASCRARPDGGGGALESDGRLFTGDLGRVDDGRQLVVARIKATRS